MKGLSRDMSILGKYTDNTLEEDDNQESNSSIKSSVFYFKNKLNTFKVTYMVRLANF